MIKLHQYSTRIQELGGHYAQMRKTSKEVINEIIKEIKEQHPTEKIMGIDPIYKGDFEFDSEFVRSFKVFDETPKSGVVVCRLTKYKRVFRNDKELLEVQEEERKDIIAFELVENIFKTDCIDILNNISYNDLDN